jgi:hypothetical protein
MELEEKKRLTSLFYSFKNRGKRCFKKQEFINWYENQENNDCYYCGIEIKTLRTLVLKGIIDSKRFFSYSYTTKKGNKKFGTRCKNFEVDRKIQDGSYSTENCVIACYFCNNDKSDIFTDVEYKIFIGAINQNKKDNPRYKYLKSLLPE